jgi:hypothetical protein
MAFPYDIDPNKLFRRPSLPANQFPPITSVIPVINIDRNGPDDPKFRFVLSEDDLAVAADFEQQMSEKTRQVYERQQQRLDGLMKSAMPSDEWRAMPSDLAVQKGSIRTWILEMGFRLYRDPSDGSLWLRSFIFESYEVLVLPGFQSFQLSTSFI